jgi:hypothetical protein
MMVVAVMVMMVVAVMAAAAVMATAIRWPDYLQTLSTPT